MPPRTQLGLPFSMKANPWFYSPPRTFSHVHTFVSIAISSGVAVTVAVAVGAMVVVTDSIPPVRTRVIICVSPSGVTKEVFHVVFEWKEAAAAAAAEEVVDGSASLPEDELQASFVEDAVDDVVFVRSKCGVDCHLSEWG